MSLRDTFTARFVAFVVVSTTLFSVVWFGLQALGTSALVAYCAGFVLSFPVEAIRDWFQAIDEREREAGVSI